MADVNKIAAEFNGDPTGRGYALMSDEERYTSIRLRDIPATQPVSSELQDLWAAEKGRRFFLYRAAFEGLDRDGNPLSPLNAPYPITSVAELRGFAMSALDMSNKLEYSYKRETHGGLLDLMVGANILTTEDKTALDGQADILVSREDQIGAGKIRMGDVVAARGIS